MTMVSLEQKREIEEFRLRESVRGHFAQLPVGEPSEDISPARILLFEDNKLAAARIIETLAGTAGDLIHVTTWEEAAERLDASIELMVVGMSVAPWVSRCGEVSGHSWT